MEDFKLINHGSIWQIIAVSDAAKDFAKENFGPGEWQGEPTNFMTDWRVGRGLAERLIDEGWSVA